MASFETQASTCKVIGRLTQQEVIALWPRRAELLTASTQVLDLSELDYSDSAGVSFLLALVQIVERSGRSLQLYAPSSQLLKLIELYDLQAFFTQEVH